MASNDISDLQHKVEGAEGANGELTANDFNRVVKAVIENQEDISKSVKTISINGSERKFSVDDKGNIDIEIVESGYDVKLLNATLSGTPANSIYYIGSGDSLIFTADLSQTYSASGEEPQPIATPCRVYFLRNDVVVGNKTAVNGDHIEFDFGPYVSGSTENTLMVKVDNLLGTVISSMPFIAKILTLRLTTNVYDSIIFKSGIGTTNPWKLETGITGDSAYVYAYVDGVSVGKSLSTGEDTSLNPDRPLKSNESLTTDVTIGLTHGSHVLEIYAESATASGVKTATQRYSFLYVDESSTARILDTSFAESTSVKIYESIKIPYWVYYSEAAGTTYNGDLKAKIYLYIDAIDDTLGGTGKPYGAKYLSETTISCINSFFKGEYTSTISEKNYQGTATAYIEIYKEGIEEPVATKRIPFIIAAPDVELSEVEGYLIKLSAEGRTNSDTNRDEWKSGNYEMLLPEDLEFTSTGSGWNKDENNNSVLRLRKGRRAYLNYKPFESEVCFPDQPANDKALGNNGITISFILKPFNASNKNSILVRCRDKETSVVDDQEVVTYKNAGFDITANSVSLYSKDKYIYCDYKENERIQIDLVIEGGAYRYRRYAQETGQIDKSLIESNECYSKIYINGVYQQLLYNELGTGYQQVNPMYVEFGSDECDLDIYEVRVYNKALNMRDILTNYSFNAPTIEEKIARLQRNDLFSDTDGYSVIDPEDNVEYYPMPLFNIERDKLVKARPDLPIWTVEMEYLPIDKGSDGRINVESTEYINPKNDGSTDDLVAQGNYSFLSGIPVDGKYNRMSCQGSSSMNYPLPYRNWDWRTGDKEKSGGNGKSKFRLSNGEELEVYSMYPNMPGIAKITLKKDYASSEMINNAVCSDIYNDMAYSIGGSYPNVKSPAQNFLSDSEKYKLALKAIPIFMYRKWGGEEEALGMMNFIPNKNEVDYLGFTEADGFKFTYDDKTPGSTITPIDEGGIDPRTPRAQSWEIVNNHVFWDIPLDEASWDPVNNVIYNPTTQENESSKSPGVYADAYYEARYPTDSSTGGDFGMGETEAHVPMVNYETELIRDFHNWMCSCNLETATNNPLSATYIGADGKSYTTDSIEYRKAKFSKEAPDRMQIDQWILYYIWREQFWMFDSGSKNLQIYTMGRQRHTEDGSYPNDAVNFYTGEALRAAEYKRGQEDLTKPYQWGCMVRDADTALGINNVGELQFPPYLEDTDLMIASTAGNPVSSIEFDYDVYPYGGEVKYTDFIGKEDSIHGGVLNGQHGAAWRLLPVCFSGRINEIYKALYVASKDKNNSSNFSYETALKKCNDHQDKWSEGLYNFGSQQYFGGAAFTKWYTAGCGNKRSQRDSWLYSGFRYRNSKYKVEENNNVLLLRPTTKGFNKCTLSINTYLPMYITGAEGGLASVKVRHIDTSKCATFDFPGMDSESDTKLLNADLITELPDLYKLGDFKTLSVVDAKRLKVLRIGNINADHSTTRRYDGFSTLIIGKGSCESLEILDVSDMINLTACSGIADQLNLKELYAVHCGLNTVILPESSSLSTVHLGSEVDPVALPTGCPIETLTAKNLVGLKDFIVVGNTMPNLRVLTIDNTNHKKLYELAINAASNRIDGKDIKILNTNWPLANWYSSDATIKRDLTSLADPSVKFTRTTIDLGTKASNLDYGTKELLAANFGDIDSPTNSLYVKYTPYTSKAIIIDIPSTIYCGNPEETYQLPFKMSSTDFTAYKLKKSSNGSYKPAVKWEFIDSRNSDYVDLSEDGTLKLKPEAIGNENISISLKVSVDIMDGFDEAVKEKIVTCNLFYHEAKPGDVVYADGSFEDPRTTERTDNPIGVCFWAEEGNKGHGLMMSINSIDTGDYISVTKYTLPCGPTPKVPDMDFVITGTEGDDKHYIVKNLDYTTINYHEDKYIIYNNYIDPLNSYKFTLNPVEGGELIKQVGYTKVLTNEEAAYLNDNLGTSYSEGDTLPQGKYNTLVTIIHRDAILSDNDIIGDSILRAPVKTSQYTEMEDLMNTLGKILIESKDTSSMYYQSERLLYPYTSACYSYNPQGKRDGINDTIAEAFREGKWWHPGVGELFRIQFYLTEATKGSIVGDKTIDPTIADSIEKFKKVLSNPYYFIGIDARSSSWTPTSDGNEASGYNTVTYSYSYGVNMIKPGNNNAGATQFMDKATTLNLSTNISSSAYMVACCEF